MKIRSVRSGKPKAQRSIAGRLTGAVLIPSVALLVMWLAVSAYLLYDGFYARAVASSVRQVSIPAVNGLASAQQERQLSMAYLGQPSVGTQQLHEQEKQTDDGLAAMKTAATSALANAPQAILTRFNTLNGYVNQLTGIRAQVDARTIGVQQVYDFYNGLLDAATNLFDTQARVVPDVNAAQGGIEATSLFRATDEMSRAASLISTALATGSLSPENHLAFVNLVGAYHGELTKTVPFLEPDVAGEYQQLTTTDAWKGLVNAENGFIERGPWSSADSGLPTDADQWQDLSNQVTAQLIKLSKQQADEVSAQALSSANSTFIGVAIGSLVALIAAITAIVVARRVSRTLVDRALVTRLARLRDEALELAHRRLPTIVARLRDGEPVDVGTDLPDLHFGADEIGEVADAFNAAQHAAVSATVQEAQARDGVHNVFLGIARRDQGLVHRLLKLLETMEREEDQPQRLERLFQLDHLATRARRNAENLIILGGELPGRRWRRPVALIDVLRAGVAETEQYRRVKVEHVPEVSIAGTAVADIIHLVAELVDNATAFSPPRSLVHVNATVVAKGVVIEVEDQGLGMDAETQERANAIMAAPPDFEAMAARGETRLGLFVIARLAARNSIAVEFRTSPYGGTRAIVLVHAKVLAGMQEEDMTLALPQPSRPELVGAETGRHNGARMSTAIEFGPDGPLEIDPVQGRPRTFGEQSGDIGGIGDIDVRWPGEDEDADDERGPAHAAPDPREATPLPQLPQRRPQDHLVPQLRNDAVLETSGPEVAGSEGDELSAEEMRSRIAAFQRGSMEARSSGWDIEQ
ncbi:MAG TPA: nitrate- and nitrite sensing domain-containing protein [Pseudonocardiaceae bacterium]|nr:nitrate- and nitrite sensing domain-containing protein [Pseudonocardiaceae bacterium]